MANEKRLIDANAIKYRMISYGGWGQPDYVADKQKIDKMPTVDAVEVVRCKDCKHLEITGCYGECGRGYMGIVKPWDFCSYGERKEDG